MPSFSFAFNDGEGTLERPRQGMEQVKLRVTRGADRGEWTAEVKPQGVVWTKDGKHIMDVPPSLQRLYQRLVFFPDPQKKEGTAQHAGDEYSFTDVSNDRYVVKVDGKGDIAEVRVNDQFIKRR